MVDAYLKPLSRRRKRQQAVEIIRTCAVSDLPEYRAWIGMNRRCTNPKCKNYCARGIRVCKHWRGPNGFVNFLTDMGQRPSDEHSLDRINNDGNYEPGNCRWATRKEQNRNRRDNVLVTFGGKTQCLVAWAEELGVSWNLLRQRLVRNRWSVERAMTTPPRMVASNNG